MEQASITEIHSYADGSRICEKCGYETECTHPDMYMVNWDASTEDLGLAKNYVQKDAEHHTYIGPATLSLYCEDCGLHTQETVESASIDMAHDLAITTACGYCGYSTTAENPDASCAHENAEPVVYFLSSNSSEGPFEYIACGDGTHTYVGPGSIRYECADCGETFEVDYDEIRYTEDCSQDQYGVCNTCDYDYSCAHANKVVSGCELLTEGAHSFTDTSERVHTYSGSANVTYSCAECHSAWVVHHEDYTAEFAHTYGDDSVCDICGREIACRHADSKAVRVAEGSGSYARAYWNTHYYTGSGTILFECRDCGGAYTVTSDSHEKVLMDCVFVHDLYCQFCDADKYCLHKSGDYTLTPVDGSFAALPDGKNHRFTGKYIFALVTCDECGAFDETLSISNSYYDEPHAFSEGVCTVCVYACEHENAAWREEILPDYANPGNFTPADSRTHDYTGPAAKTGDCPDCGETVSAPLNETASLTGLAHTYDGDVCTACGYENTCVHGELYTVEGEGSVVECEPLDDGYTHAKTVAHAVHTRCADCGVLLGSRTVSETFNEAHSASGCAECGYVCPHVYSKSETVYSADEFYFHSKTEHLFIGEMEVTETCRHCGEIILHYIREDYTCYLPHEYDANNVCTACGYESACEHSYTDHVIERDRAYLGQSVPVDAFCDLYTSPAIEYAWCELCGTLRQTVTEPVSTQYPHEFVNGKCIWCNYEHSCLHPEEAIERTYTATDSSCKCERVDDSYHIFVSGTYLLEGICTLCGDTVLNRYIDADGILERHDSNNFGLCQNCQTTNLCSHIGHGIAPEFDPARADEFVYEIVSDSAHRITGPARLSGVCSGCGEALDEEGVFTIEENHTFGEDGICTACSYFSGCAHPSLLRYEILVPSIDGTFAPAENGHIFTGVCTRETWCASCGLMIASEPTESGVFEFDHVFADGVCIHCGAEGSCDHANTQQWIETELTGEAEYSTNLYHTTVGSRYRITACTDCSETLENKLIKANIAVNEPHTDNGSNRCADCGGVFVCSHSGAVDQVSIDYDSAEFAPYDEIQHKIHGNLIRTTYCPACRTMPSESEVVAAGCTMLEVHIFDENHVCMLCGYDSGYECTHENLYTERQMIPSWSEPMNDGQHLSCGCMYVMELCMDCGALVRSEMEGGLVEQAQDHSYSNGMCTECYHVGGCAHSHWESISYDQVLQTADVRDSHHTLYIGSFTARLCSDCGEEFNIRMDGVSMQDEAHLMDNGYYCSVCYYYGSVPATSISAGSKLTLGVGTTHQLKPAVQPANATGKMTYSSSKASVAKVDENGLITAVKAGTATITVKCGAKSAKVTVTVKKAPSSIKLSPAAGTLGVGQTGTLKYTLSSGSAGTVSFVSGNPAVATVDENGKVTAVGAGTAVITAITQNGKTAKSTITVKPAPSKITLSASEYVLGEMQSFTLKASVNEGSLGTITFQSLNPDIASVSANGVITARHTGFATIVASAQNGVAASCRVEVKPGPSCVTVTEDQLILGVKQTHKIGYVLGAENEDCMGSVTFSSSKPKVASVDANGKITALRTGTTVITLTTQNDKTARVTVTVKKAPSSIKLSPTSTTLGVGDSGTLKYTLSSGSAAAVQFSSSDTSVAAVDENGMITAVSVGSATITAKTHNGKKATCKVTVKAAPTSIELNKSELILTYGETFDLNHKLSENSHSTVRYSISGDSGITVDPVSGAAKVTEMCPVERHAVITASTHVEGVTAQCEVTVPADPTEVFITSVPVLGVKMTGYLTAATDTAGSITFHCDANSYFTLSSDGKITAKKAGTAMVYAKTFNGIVSEPVAVTISPAPSKVVIPATLTLGVGEAHLFTPEFGSESEVGTCTFKSSKSATASISAEGLLTAKKAGSVTITVTTHNGKKDTCKVTIKKAPTSVTLNKTSVTVGIGESFTLKGSVNSGAGGVVKFDTADTSLVQVSKSGNITGLELGTAVVRGYTYNEQEAFCTVEVVPAAAELTVPESMLLGLGEVNTLNIAAKDADGQPYKGSVSVKFSSAGVVSHSDGTIVALKKGSTIATVTAGNLSAACKITVKNYSEVHTAVAVAHRGGKNYWPENTLEAFTNMTSTGADMVELDVQTTKDGLQILNHDLYLTVNGQKHYISDYTYEELLAMKPNLCTLDQALEVISATGMTLQLELKDGATTTKCVDAIRKYGMQDRTIYISFNTTKLQEVRDYDPTASLGMCFESIPSDLMETVKKLDLEVIFPKHKLITEARLLSWHKAGLDVGAWTLNTPELIRKFLKMGVDYITSDSPDLIVKEIAKL